MKTWLFWLFLLCLSGTCPAKNIESICKSDLQTIGLRASNGPDSQKDLKQNLQRLRENDNGLSENELALGNLIDGVSHFKNDLEEADFQLKNGEELYDLLGKREIILNSLLANYNSLSPNDLRTLQEGLINSRKIGGYVYEPYLSLDGDFEGGKVDSKAVIQKQLEQIRKELDRGKNRFLPGLKRHRDFSYSDRHFRQNLQELTKNDADQREHILAMQGVFHFKNRAEEVSYQIKNAEKALGLAKQRENILSNILAHYQFLSQDDLHQLQSTLMESRKTARSIRGIRPTLWYSKDFEEGKADSKTAIQEELEIIQRQIDRTEKYIVEKKNS